MSNETKQPKAKGRLSKLIPVLEIVLLLAYFAIYFPFGLADNSPYSSAAFSIMDSAGYDPWVEYLKGIRVWFICFMVAQVAVSVMCFLKQFKSSFNKFLAIVNIIWIVYELFTCF